MAITHEPVKQAETTGLTDEVRRQVRAMRRNGVSRDEIAAQLGISKSSTWHAYNSYSNTEVAEMQTTIRRVRDMLMARLRVQVLADIAPNPIIDEDFALVEMLNQVLEN